VQADGNRYEGAWENDQPHGTGVFFYPSKVPLATLHSDPLFAYPYAINVFFSFTE